MNEKMKAFYEAVSADDALELELQGVIEGVDLEGVEEAEARQAMADAVAAFANAHELDLTAADILAADAAGPEGELSAAELANVAGGGNCGCFIIGAAKGCGCFIYGQSSSTRTSIGGCPVVGGAVIDDAAKGYGKIS